MAWNWVFTLTRNIVRLDNICFSICSQLLIILAGCRPMSGMCCVMFYSYLFISAPSGQHIQLQQASIIIHTTARDNQRDANYFVTSALAGNQMQDRSGKWRSLNHAHALKYEKKGTGEYCGNRKDWVGWVGRGLQIGADRDTACWTDWTSD